MNIRSLTRGDGVVIGAAVLLLIASFLDYSSIDCSGPVCDRLEQPNAWDPGLFPVLPSVFLAGIIAAVLIVASRFQPEGRKLVGLGLDQWGSALAVFAAWTALWTLFIADGTDKVGPGLGRILGFVATLLLAAGALLSSRVAGLKTPLLPAPRPQAAPQYGGGQPHGYGYPGQQGVHQQYGGPQQQQQPYGVQPNMHHQGAAQAQHAGPAAGAQPGPSGADFAPFWFAVPVTRPLYAEDGSQSPVAELAPGTWYLAVDQRGQALVAQTQDGRRGVLQDTSGIQRG
ncbi:hypothetical protein [Streptomyces meridianus]|uniref:Integral membrane protein n=1 Tax=Streptomyces meridianus TaxID=2938945 RepID=A0ABT0XBZ3_9ACTN|nr:hypothetical protein [Streptomyces meridianus]MCM2579319.1 hypothetical protein [Streptomyces meridianus]